MALETAKKLRIRTSILPQPGRARCLEQCRLRAGRGGGSASLASECSAGEPLVTLGARNEIPFELKRRRCVGEVPCLCIAEDFRYRHTSRS
jgi:hypothetical protein